MIATASCAATTRDRCPRSPAARGFSALGALTLTAVVTLAQAPSAAEAMRLAREGAAAADAGDSATYLARMEAAAALRPDYPRILVNLAAAQLATGNADAALAALGRLAALGFHSPVEKSPEFAALRGRREFDTVVGKLAANLYPQGAGEVAFTLKDVTGLIEGIAWREKTDTFYFGDVNGRAIWRRQKDGKLQRLAAEGDELLGVFGLAIDEAGGAVWAATSAVPAMRGFAPEQDGTAALAEVDLESGQVRRTIPIVRRSGDQQSHVLGDLVLAPDGSIYLPDSGGPTLWRLPPGGGALEPFVEHAEFLSLQGIVVLPSGVAILSDHANGLLRVDLANRQVQRIASPADTSLIGLDGLALAPDGYVLAIQNGLRPNRVLRIDLDETGETVTRVTILESAHLTMAAPSLGCLGPGGDFYFVGNAGWTRFENTGGEPSAPRTVPIFHTTLPKRKR